MKFEMKHKVGTHYSTVTFKPHAVKGHALFSILDIFLKLGGEMGVTVNDWKFSKHITSEVIDEVIHNTCFVCGGLMKDSIALDNTWVSFDDFGGDAGQRGTTCSKQGQPIIKKVRKCTSCGHSHT